MTNVGTVQERTTRLSNALRCSAQGISGWAILLAVSEVEARSIVLEAARDVDVPRTDIHLTEYPGPRPDKIYRFRVDVFP